MSSFKTVLKVMAAGAVLSGVAFAQSSVRVTVKVPYDFHVGANRLPAGEYNLTADMGSQFLKVTSRDTRHGLVRMTLPQFSGVQGIPYAHVAFRVYGEQYYLASVWVPGADGRSFQLSPAEREAAKANSRMTIALLRAEQR